MNSNSPPWVCPAKVKIFPNMRSSLLAALRDTLVYLRSSTPMIADDSLNDRLPLYHQIKIRKGG